MAEEEISMFNCAIFESSCLINGIHSSSSTRYNSPNDNKTKFRSLTFEGKMKNIQEFLPLYEK